MAKAAAKADPAWLKALGRYDRLIATVPGVERKGASVPYTAMNGNMSSYLHARGEVALRLPREAREAFLAEYGATLFEAYGVVQKEYVTVPDALLADTEALAPWFRVSCAYVAGLKPKPGGKRK